MRAAAAESDSAILFSGVRKSGTFSAASSSAPTQNTELWVNSASSAMIPTSWNWVWLARWAIRSGIACRWK